MKPILGSQPCLNLDLGQISKLRAFRECRHKNLDPSSLPLAIPELVAVNSTSRSTIASASLQLRFCSASCGRNCSAVRAPVSVPEVPLTPQNLPKSSLGMDALDANY